MTGNHAPYSNQYSGHSKYTVKEAQLQDSEKCLSGFFCPAAPQKLLPRQRFEHQSDLAKENPEKQELKI